MAQPPPRPNSQAHPRGLRFSGLGSRVCGDGVEGLEGLGFRVLSFGVWDLLKESGLGISFGDSRDPGFRVKA